jgi:tetratricopeptide (TPR) repeat protein
MLYLNWPLGATNEEIVHKRDEVGCSQTNAPTPSDDVVTRCRQALATSPEDPRLHNNLGNALLHAGRIEEAASHYRTVLASNPDDLLAHNNLGNALQALKRAEDALTHYQCALAIRPDYPEVHNNAAAALISLGRFEQAIAHLERAILAKPNYAEAHNNMSIALTKCGRLGEALNHGEKANALSPGRPQIHLSLGNILQEVERSEEAIAHFDAAITADPSCAEAWNNLSTALCDIGRFEEARTAAANAIKLQPENPRFYLTLTQCQRITADDPVVAAMEALASGTAALSEEGRISLHFALGKAFADIQQFDRSFRHLREGNALKRRQTSYDETEILAFIDRIQSEFTPELMHAKQGQGDPSCLPIFIIGMPRSGTTLVEQMLASHPLVFGAGERTAFVMGVTEYEGRKLTALDFPGIIRVTSGEYLRRLAASYIKEIRRGAPDVARVTDKLPSNYLFTGLIHLALPNARIIHMRRNPLDTCVSCFSILFRSGHAYSYDLGELGRYFRAYERLMAHWRQVLPERVMLEVDYENLVGDFEGEARRIVAHCDLEWNPRCLAFYDTARPVRTASATQVRRPIYSSAIGRWHAYEPHLRPLFDALESSL